MRTFSFPSLVLSAALLALLVAVACPSAHAAPTDIVPRGDIAYDLLGSLGAAGQLPGYSLRDFARGDRLYTRAEIAAILSQSDRDAPSRYGAAYRVLRIEFAPELARLGDRRTARSVAAPRTLLTGQAKVRAFTHPDGGDIIGRVSGTLPVGRDGYAVVSAGNYRNEWYVAPRGGGPGAYPLVETAYLRVNGRAADVSVGQMPIRWGPGYSGSLLFSDEATSFPLVQIEKGFTLPGRLGHHIGPLYYRQFAGRFWEADVAGANPDARGASRFTGGRRLEAGGGPWSFAFAEGYKSTRLPDPLLAAVLPFYVYQNDWTKYSSHRLLKFLATSIEPDTNWFNYAADIDVAYRTDARTGATVYGDLFIDDITTSSRSSYQSVGVNKLPPNRLGHQVGVYVPRMGGGQYGLRLEYTSVDPTTYTDVSAPVTWYRDGRPLGFAGGPNTRSLLARVDGRVGDRVRVAIEGEDRRPRDPNLPAPQQYFRSRVALFGTYALRRDLFVGTRVEHRQVAGSSPATGYVLRGGTRFEVSAGYGF